MTRENFDINNEYTADKVDGFRAMIQVDVVAQLKIHEVHTLILRMAAEFPQSLTDFVGLSGDGRTQVKGMFTRTTYTDRSENETENGYRATADRIMRNIVRNYEEQAANRG